MPGRQTRVENAARARRERLRIDTELTAVLTGTTNATGYWNLNPFVGYITHNDLGDIAYNDLIGRITFNIWNREKPAREQQAKDDYDMDAGD